MEQTVEKLGKYVDLSNPLFAYMVEKWGSGLERFSNEEKVFLIQNIAEDIDVDRKDPFSQEIYDLTHMLMNEIRDDSDAIALIKFLAKSL